MISAVCGQTVGADVISTICGLAIGTYVVSAVSGQTIGANMVRTVGGLTVRTGVRCVGMRRTAFCYYSAVKCRVLFGHRQSECARCQN